MTGIPYAKRVRFALMYMIGLPLVWLIATFIPWLSLGLMPTPG